MAVQGHAPISTVQPNYLLLATVTLIAGLFAWIQVLVNQRLEPTVLQIASVAIFAIIVALTVSAVLTVLSSLSRRRTSLFRLALRAFTMSLVVLVVGVATVLLVIAGGYHFLGIAIRPFILPIILFAAAAVSAVLADLWQLRFGGEQVTLFTNRYVKPWQRSFALKTLLVLKQIRADGKFEETMRYLDALLEFLDRTDATRYLRDTLTMPSASFAKTGDTQIGPLRSSIRKCDLRSLRTVTDGLKDLKSRIVSGAEKEVRANIESLVGTIMGFQEVNEEIREDLHVDDTVDLSLLVDTGSQQWPLLSRDIKTPEEWELEIWERLTPASGDKVTVAELKRDALLQVAFFVLFLGLMMTVPIVVVALQFRYFLASPSIYTVLLLLMMALIVIYAAWMLRTTMPTCVRNYRALDAKLKGRVIFTEGDLERACLQTIRDGMGRTELPTALSFGSAKIEATDFIYRCACAFVTTQSDRKPEPIIDFPSPTTLAISTQHFFHVRAHVQSPFAMPIPAPSARLSAEQFSALSSQIISQCESRSLEAAVDKKTEDTLVWLYSNAVRVVPFDELEIAEVGRLPSYRPYRLLLGFREQIRDRLHSGPPESK
jgi:hypothetical protein